MDNKAYGYLKSSEQNHMKTLEQYVKDKRSIVTDEKGSRDGYNYLKNRVCKMDCVNSGKNADISHFLLSLHKIIDKLEKIICSAREIFYTLCRLELLETASAK